MSSQLNPVTSVSVRYNWVDSNHDGFVQPNELYDRNGVPLFAGGSPAAYKALSGNWNPANPGSPTTNNTIDPNLKNDITAEVIVGADHQVTRDFAIGGSYIFRRCAHLNWTPYIGVSTTGGGYSAATFPGAGGAAAYAASCPAAQNADCPSITYYQPNAALPAFTTLTNTPFYRTYNGVEMSARKRMSSRWLMDTSFSYNTAIQHYPVGSYQDPSNIQQRNGFQYDYMTSGSGIGNVYVNAKWLYKLSGLYELPAQFKVSAFFNTRQGYPFERFVQVASRNNGAGSVSILLDNVGDSRLPDYKNLDFHVQRPISFEVGKFVPSLDIFNLANSNIVQAIRGTQNASNANQIQAIVAPRVLRFGFRASW